MRLCNIKLSGFKSFVDPTNLIVPANLVGIVGPNGCGKSNIIDAVTWVMGESSARHLRGKSLTDVIFSGSSVRQPVSQASVELIFDNTKKKLGGQYASYSEISVKRQINRDGISTYYLNGTRCRRRDITAIFLGTGLGPRSYSIIEQGMISRLIEAKPEELRVYIEEAAGISKYRERRRETENRIRHTRENIERLNDIRDELEKQLNHLQRQAVAAERYKELKQEERQLSVELLAINWRNLKVEMATLNEQCGEKENALEASLARVRAFEADIEKQREALTEANQCFNERQSEFYQAGSDISQYEQQLRHTRETIAATEQELAKVKADYDDSVRRHEQDKSEYESLISELDTLRPQLDGSRTESNHAYELLNQSEEAMQAWQREWDRFNESFSAFSRQEQIDRSRLEYLQSGLDELNERRYQLQTESDTYQAHELESEIWRLQHALQHATEKLGQKEKEHADYLQQVKSSREEMRGLSDSLNTIRHISQKEQGKLTSLETLQQSVIDHNQELQDWLKENQFDNLNRLSQLIQIDEKWAHALETVIGNHLHDLCIESFENSLDIFANAPGRIGLMSIGHNTPASALLDKPRLIDFIRSNIKVPSLLNTVYVAESMSAAKALLSQLPAVCSVVTRDGVWFGHNHLLINHSIDAEDTIISREQEISCLKASIINAEEKLQALEQQQQQAETILEQREQQLLGNQAALNARQQEIADIRAELAAINKQQEQQTLRSQQIFDDIQMINQQEQTYKGEIEAISNRLSELDQDKQKYLEQKQSLGEVKEQHRQALAKARSRWQSTHEESHGIALQLEAYSSKKTVFEQAFKRNEIQLKHLNTRSNELEQQLQATISPVAELEAKIKAALKQKLEAENKLASARSNVQLTDNDLRQLEQQRQQQEQGLETLRAALEKARIDANSCQIRLETVLEKLSAHEQQPETILQQLNNDEASQSAWTEKLEAIAHKVQRLGPINLAAIDEYAQNAERKIYLDSQHKDLTEALTTLENAIKKIDKETRTRFKETFDQLNANIKEMFPQLFGGGHAYLELTGGDLLQTGVAIMARPPGKKNSNIHLLSGGEKALTAVALVFAIFRLNPAPFCILDEVDAPLDDTNVGRFSALLKSMSDEVQFVFITHNKITMEVAQQLTGVTMYEPGVSRLVSVDVDEAAKMAATA